ncbi:hypothetical protein [Actinoplanes friuliensis]|uniref:Uncharacterized protein n=1 Tax=Actinoplanes friuliensis DSM 7358 TaxID=1246995 RepID=U5VYZ9_9ACTN|nr:hypothetical protein [Actinoplanes friuliensis]AGZ42007.1 hypothetical protein AFR_18645 [Actinoplanes friuliensis DSM 7358]
MPRSPAGAADHELILILALDGFTVSPYQLERWRTAGLLPRNQRRGLGRGRGSVSVLSPEAVECARMLERCSRTGPDLVGRILWRFYDLAMVSFQDATAIPEHPVRKALDTVFSGEAGPQRDEDSAYADAEREAKADKYLARQGIKAFLEDFEPLGAALSGERRLSDEPEHRPKSRTDLRSLRPALQHLLAARSLGVDTVGHDLIEESIVALGWAAPDHAGSLTRYLACTFHQAETHRRLVRDLGWDGLCATALVAGRLHTTLLHAHQRLERTPLRWMVTCDYSLLRPWLLHMALVLDEDFLSEALPIAAHPDGTR